MARKFNIMPAAVIYLVQCREKLARKEGYQREIVLFNYLCLSNICAFMTECSLSLSLKKTLITFIKEGFAFLGHTFCKHFQKLHITPSSQGVQTLIQKIRTIIRNHVSFSTYLSLFYDGITNISIFLRIKKV